jgi:hypothetical protein
VAGNLSPGIIFEEVRSMSWKAQGKGMSKGMSPELLKKETDGTTATLKVLERKDAEHESRRGRRWKVSEEVTPT